MEKGCCELCSKTARMYCDSDQARLCWDCDEKVHSANFLVAKHSRNLLCHVCQSPTPWTASGTKLSPTISVCESCSDHSNTQNQAARRRRQEQVEEAEDETDESPDDEYSESENDDEYDYGEEDDEIEEEDDEEDGENQVVPWSSCHSPSSSPLPLTTSSSGEHGSFSARYGGAAVSSAVKRSRDNRLLDSDDEDVCCSSQGKLNMDPMENRRASLRSLKMAR